MELVSEKVVDDLGEDGAAGVHAPLSSTPKVVLQRTEKPSGNSNRKRKRKRSEKDLTSVPSVNCSQ